MAEVHTDQAFLVARDTLGCLSHILAARGGWAIRQADEAAADLADVIGLGEEYHPRSPGLWVWSGTATVRDPDPDDYEAMDEHEDFRTDVEGELRLAVIGDFAVFGLPTPLPRVPEGAAHG